MEEASLNRASSPVRELSAKAVHENPAKYDYVTAIHAAAALSDSFIQARSKSQTSAKDRMELINSASINVHLI